MAKRHQNLEAGGDEKLKINFMWPYSLQILYYSVYTAGIMRSIKKNTTFFFFFYIYIHTTYDIYIIYYTYSMSLLKNAYYGSLNSFTTNAVMLMKVLLHNTGKNPTIQSLLVPLSRFKKKKKSHC